MLKVYFILHIQSVFFLFYFSFLIYPLLQVDRYLIIVHPTMTQISTAQVSHRNLLHVLLFTRCEFTWICLNLWLLWAFYIWTQTSEIHNLLHVILLSCDKYELSFWDVWYSIQNDIQYVVFFSGPLKMFQLVKVFSFLPHLQLSWNTFKD